MKNLKSLNLLMTICIGLLFTGVNILTSKKEVITSYTHKDIIFLQGHRVFSESGEYDCNFYTRKDAVDFFENITVEHANEAYFSIIDCNEELRLYEKEYFSPLKREVLRNNRDNEYLIFEYIDEYRIRATALKAIWLTVGYPGDTILLNTHDDIILNVPDDEFNVSVGNGNDDVKDFIF